MCAASPRHFSALLDQMQSSLCIAMPSSQHQSQVIEIYILLLPSADVKDEL